ncbi:MAG: uridine kinase [Cyclobacteriaceae bacterium]
MKKAPYIIGITGGTGSGKSAFLQKITERFTDDEVCVISQDDYYKPMDQQPVDENGVINFDLLETIDNEKFSDDIKQLKEGNSVQILEYTFNNPKADAKKITLKPAPVNIVEGLFVFHYPEIREQLDLKLYVETDKYLMLKRRIIRDQKERGYDVDDVMYRFENHFMPTFEKYIEPLKKDADLVIPNYNNFDQALEVISTVIKSNL